MATRVNDGVYIDYTPVGAVSNGDVVVLGTRIGIADQDIAAGIKGALAKRGVYALDKSVTSSDAITVGTYLYWDAGSEVVTETSSTNAIAGVAVLAAAASATTVNVSIDW